MEKALELFTVGAAIQGIFLATILGRNKKGNKRANIFLSILLLLFSTIIFHSSYILVYIEHKFSYVIKMNEPFLLLIGPFIYFYVRELTSEKLVFSKKDIVHFLPICFYFIVSTLAMAVGQSSKYFEPVNNMVAEGVSWVLIVILFAYYMRKIVKLSGIHEKRIEEEFSTIDEIGLEWIKNILTVFMVVFIVLVTGFFIKIIHGNNGSFGETMALVSALIIYVMGYRGLRQPDIFHLISLNKKINMPKNDTESNFNISEDKESKEKYKNSSLSTDDIKDIEKRINEFMENEKPYLNPDFNMEMLTEAIGVNKNYVSQVINSKLGYNFFNYVNHYRVEEVKLRMISPENDAYTILSIAFDSGFNSKASFNSIFKKFTGLTPSEYRKTQ